MIIYVEYPTFVKASVLFSGGCVKGTFITPTLPVVRPVNRPNPQSDVTIACLAINLWMGRCQEF